MEYSETEKRSLMTAIGVIFLSIVAVVAFVLTGGGALFYAIAVIVIALAFYMAYRISQEGVQETKKRGQSRKK